MPTMIDARDYGLPEGGTATRVDGGFVWVGFSYGGLSISGLWIPDDLPNLVRSAHHWCGTIYVSRHGGTSKNPRLRVLMRKPPYWVWSSISDWDDIPEACLLATYFSLFEQSHPTR